MKNISKELRAFLAKHFSSVRQLEVFLTVATHPEKEWTADELARILCCNDYSTAKWLDDFQRRGLIVSSDKLKYRFQPGDRELDKMVKELAKHFKERQSKVIDLIYDPNIDKMQSFMDAFRIKKDRKDDDG